MKLLVTGGAGFIGSNFIRYWRKRYPTDSITNIDKLTYAGNLNNLKNIESDSLYRFIHQDICDASDLLEQAIEACDVIIHFAAESHVDRSLLSANEFLKTNVLGTYNLLTYAQKYMKRFHYISTDEVFGSLPLDSKEKFSETTPYDPRNPYASSKASADHMVRAFFHTYGLPITISNCSNNFGPYQHKEKFIPRIITNLLSGKKAPVYGQGLNVRDWLYVEDHCRAIDLIVHKGILGETYCIGGMTDDITNKELAETITRMMGLETTMIEYVEDRPGHDLRYAIDWSKAKRELGYEPSHDFSLYLEKTITWYQSNRAWWEKQS